jgi:hypothetical protein
MPLIFSWMRLAAASNGGHQLQPSDLVYRGAFRYPADESWAYSGHALTYYPEGDPTGVDDGYPGSLYAVGHSWQQLVGELSIPSPKITDQFGALPQATVLQPLTDITGGWINNCTFDDDCIYREVAGLAYLPGLERIAWNLRDWYNVDADDQDSLGWSDLDLGNAQGVWHIGERSDDAFHNAKTSDYLFTAPKDYAATYLQSRWLLAGNHREAGAFGGSQGPTLYATAPWREGDPPVPGQELNALALFYYPESLACTQNHTEACAFDGYRVDDHWGGGAWVQAGPRHAVLITGRKGLGDNCYGVPGEDCLADACNPYKGWHSPPYEPQILFYDPIALIEVTAGEREPWSVQPYAVYRPLDELFDRDCGLLNAAAYDATRNLVYVAETEAGPWGETAIHVWKVRSGETITLPLLLKGY